MFTHLHTHTEYSLLDGSNKIIDYVDRVKELGMDSCAITDHGAMYGAIKFYKYAKQCGIKPIIGCEVYVSGVNSYNHLILLAENNKGYKNLIKIVSYGFIKGFYRKPQVTKDILAKYSDGLIASSACLKGEIPEYILNNDLDKARETILEYIGIFGENNFFLELMDTGISVQRMVNLRLIQLAKELDVGLIATADIHYTKKEDKGAHDVLLCIQTNKMVSDENRLRYHGEYYVKSEDEMRALFSDIPEAIDNTWIIANRCNVDIDFHELKLPKYQINNNISAYEYLEKLCISGLKKRYKAVTEELETRLYNELKTISDMGFVDYFLIVWDFIKYARDRDIPVGPGRGSSAGSLVAYSLGITNVDPIKYHLIFERFLNKERVSMPDIDIDFCYKNRSRVIDYVKEKYGNNNVAQIITFGTLAARAAIKDVARVMNIPYSKADTIAKMIPSVKDITIETAIKENKELRDYVDKDDTLKELVNMAKKLEGLPKNASTHAAGVVICGNTVDSFVPIYKNSDGIIATQYTKSTIEELGLLKMDFLGLRTLTVIKTTCDLANIKIDNIKYDDENVFKLISTGNTDGIFQLESSGMKSFMKELKPTCIDDIIAGISLYRPGPMDFIPKYIKGKENPSTVKYDLEILEDILKPTYGCIVYQEQVMEIVRKLAGYSLGRSDIVRRAMSNKKQDIMLKERQNFIYGNEKEGIKGCINNGIEEKIAIKIYDDMLDFANYAFNKSHAACYAVIAYQTAYLKCYYEVEFMTALLSSVIDSPNKMKDYLSSCKSNNISVLHPDINRGGADFKCVGNEIIFALDSIKGVGTQIAVEIENERKNYGEYRNLYDFISRLKDKKINKKVIESLIKSGALDSFGNRRQLMEGFIPIMEDIIRNENDNIKGQISLFENSDNSYKDHLGFNMPDVPEYSHMELLDFEKEVIGIYVSGHPLDDFKDLINLNVNCSSKDLEPENIERISNKDNIIMAGIIIDKKIKYTKKNLVMAEITLDDWEGEFNSVIFPNVYDKNLGKLEIGKCVIIIGNLDSYIENKPAKLLAKDIYICNDLKPYLWIKFDNESEYNKKVYYINKEIDDNKGDSIVYLYIENIKKIINMGDKRININDALINRLKNTFGNDRVKITQKNLIKR